MDINSDLFKEMLGSKEKVVERILSDLETSMHNATTFNVLLEKLEKGEAIDDRKVYKAFAKALKNENQLNARVLVMLLVYVSGANFSGDLASVLMKLGRGKEAVQELFKQKLDGTG